MKVQKMFSEPRVAQDHTVAAPPAPAGRRERGILLVVSFSAITMVLEIAVGYATHSMALLADGWHMATHVGALGLASIAYWVSRRFAGHRAFTFGTGKVRALAGYTSALILALVAVAMIVESAIRLVGPHSIDYVSSLPVALLGLCVNLASVLLLHVHDDEHGHDDDQPHDHDYDYDHDHNHRAAFLHVVADTFTSALAIVALLAGKFFGLSWLDPVSGVVGGLLILKWGAGLLRSTSFELLDVAVSRALDDEIRRELESLDDVRVHDLRVWSLGGGEKSCILTLVTSTPREAHSYHQALSRFSLAHLTIEVRRCEREQVSEPESRRA